MATCTKCGQSEPVVTFRMLPDGVNQWGACRSCERDDTRERRSGKHEIPNVVTRSAMDELRAKAPRMEHQRRAQDNEVEKLREKVKLLESVFPTAPNVIAAATEVQGRAVACMVASDWHVEEPVEKDKVHGLNEFNLEI